MAEPQAPIGAPDGAAAPSASPWRVRAALLTVQLVFGVHYLAAKWIVSELAPAAWACLRVGAAAVVFLLLAGLGRRRLPPRRDLLYLGLCAFFGIVLNQALFLEGVARTTPGNSALMNTQIPTFALVAAVLLRDERLTRAKVLSLVLGLAGVMILLEADRLRLTSRTLTGDLLNLGNAASYGLFVAMSRRVMERTDTLAAAAVVFGFGAIGMALYGLPALLAADLTVLSARAVWSMVFTILAATVVTYFLNLWALRRAQASRVALWIVVQPLIAAALSAWLMRERPTPRFAAAAVLVCLALALQDAPIRLRPRAWSGTRGSRR